MSIAFEWNPFQIPYIPSHVDLPIMLSVHLNTINLRGLDHNRSRCTVMSQGEGRAVKKLEQGPDGPGPGKRRDCPGK